MTERIATPGHSEPRTPRSPRGSERSCRGWSQEAALRMLLNGLDPEVAGPASQAVDWRSFAALVESLRDLENDETLLVLNGNPAGIFRTREAAPRVLISGENPAGNWSRIGVQENLLETFQTFASAGRKHFAGDLSGRLIVTGGMGKMGGAQPLAAAMNGAAILCIEVDPERIKQWMKAGFCDVMVNSLDEALRILKNAVRKKEPAAVGLAGNCADVVPELASRGVVPDLLTDQTRADDPLHGYIPSGLTPDRAAELRRRDPDEYRKRAMESIARHFEGMLALAKLGSIIFEYGNHICARASEAGVENACDFPDFSAAYLRPLFCEGRVPVRCIALSGEPEDIHRIDRVALDLFAENETLSRWIRLARRQLRFQGLPARALWLGFGDASRFGVAINDLVKAGELKAPIAIACDALGEKSDAVESWLPLSALLGAASGACFISFQSGGLRRVTQMVVADGTQPMATRIERVLANHSAAAIAHYAVSGCPEAIDFARRQGMKISVDESEGASGE
jgi:urocanate hydratase